MNVSTDNIQNFVLQLRIIQWAGTVCASCLGIAFGALGLYLRSTRKGFEKDDKNRNEKIVLMNDTLSMDVLKLVSVNEKLWEIARKNENNITRLIGDVKRIEEICKVRHKDE